MKSVLWLWPLVLSLTSCAMANIQIKENHPRFDQAPYVLLISIDGYRHDYNELYKPPNLTKFAKEGVSAKSLIPGFPSKTFPSHLSQVTGLYPGRHGIVDNAFYAPELNKNYNYKDRSTVIDGQFYSGVPLWSLASQHQMVSGVYFWPGSEAPINGHFPSHYVPYEHSTPHMDRINKVMEWIKLPLRERPHFLSLYFSDVDSAGHRYGPRSEEVRQAVLKVDQSLGYLFQQLRPLGLDINIVITSDHGMAALDESKKFLWIRTRKLIDFWTRLITLRVGYLCSYTTRDNQSISKKRLPG